ncbi:hypothetical protein BGX28_007389 [Mortierella sp. GBA30]|nr:hypothetical protein BGX28_007389 [Mortierella sp. GBA30]
MSVCLGEDPRPCADGEFSIVDDENSTLSVHHGSPSASSGTITPDKNHTMRATGSVLGDGSTGCATPASLTASDASSVCTLRPGEMDGLLSSDHLLQAQKTYWLKAIKGASSVISLPTDHPRPSEPIYTEAEHPFRIDLTLRQMLARLSQEHDLSLTHTVLAGWIIVLSRLSGQENIVIGTNFDETEIHNKGNKEQSSSLLPLRVDLSEESNTVEILERMRRTIVANEIHRRPFNEIVDLLPSSENAFSMTQAAFLWHKEGLRQQSISAQFDLVLHLGQDEDQLLGKICYAKSLFSSDTIKRYSGYLMAVLTSMVTDGNQPVATFDIISPAEKKLMLETWNDSTAQYPADRCIHDQFEDQVQKSPQAIAIVHQDLSLTYRELNCRANALAQRLLETGIKCGEFVAVMLPRSIGLVTAQLAILKVGAAYVPIDIKAPLDRKAFIIKDSAARLVITNSNTHDPSALDIPLFHLGMCDIQTEKTHCANVLVVVHHTIC